MTAKPLDMQRVVHQLAQVGLAGTVTYKATCLSTNDEVLAIDPAGQPQGWTAAVTDEQTAGRGRLDRTWLSAFGTGVLLSVASYPVPPEQRHRTGVLPLAVGAAIAQTLQTQGVPAQVKWPNDIVVSMAPSWGKLGGLLLQGTPTATIVGVGLNFSATPVLTADQRGQLPTSLVAAGLPATIGREDVVADVIAAVIHVRDRFHDGDAEGLLAEYRAQCITLGAQVAVQLPSGRRLVGVAAEIDEGGQLVVLTDEGEQVAVNAGDVTLVRASDE